MQTTPPHIYNTKITQDSRTILATGLKRENQHTRRTLGTLSWVYKPSDYPMVIGPWLSLVGRTSHKTYGQLTLSGVEMHIPPPCYLKKQAQTGQDGLSSYSSRQMEQVVMRLRPSTATASQRAIHQCE